MSDEVIKPPATPDNGLASALNYVGTKTRVKFDGSCLRQDKITFNHGKIVNITLENCLFGAVKITKNADIDQYKCSGYGIGLDSRGTFLFPSGKFAENVIIFGVDMSSSVHVDNKKIYFNSW